ncbi:MAG: hypothetical protein R2795_19900 [Saprospiraceae bacterium]
MPIPRWFCSELVSDTDIPAAPEEDAQSFTYRQTPQGFEIAFTQDWVGADYQLVSLSGQLCQAGKINSTSLQISNGCFQQGCTYSTP